MGHTPRIEKLIGKKIDQGRLCLVKPLGHGASGIVFKAIDTRSPKTAPREYAVKCMFREQEGSRRFLFQKREIHFHSTLSSHPNILSLHKVLLDGPYVFLVMDYCPGGDMFKFLTERHTYCRKDELVRSVFVQLIDAVQACHDQGMYHRDIKPENIMCSADGTEVRLGDFGLATGSKWSTNFGAGTVAYMSPECIGYPNGPSGYSPRHNDVWSLGIIFTSMISGHNPWKSAVLSDECFRAFIRDPNFLKSMLPISDAASTILQRIFVAPKQRISLSELRQLVLEADTFFMTDQELSQASSYVQWAAASYMGLHSSSPQESYAGMKSVVIDITSAQHSEHRLEGEGAEGEKQICSLPDDPADHQTLLLPHAHAQPAILSDSLVSDVARHPTTARRPPPQPMPSFKDLMDPPPTLPKKSLKKRIWIPDSPINFIRRIMFGQASLD